MKKLIVVIVEYLAAHYNPVLDMTFDWMEAKEE